MTEAWLLTTDRREYSEIENNFQFQQGMYGLLLRNRDNRQVGADGAEVSHRREA